MLRAVDANPAESVSAVRGSGHSMGTRNWSISSRCYANKEYATTDPAESGSGHSPSAQNWRILLTHIRNNNKRPWLIQVLVRKRLHVFAI